jgi:gluconate 5-dehydrogenase
MNVKQLFDLTGRVALVTGGSRGLGLQMAEALGEMGARLALTARKKDELDEAVARHKAQGLEAMPGCATWASASRLPRSSTVSSPSWARWTSW